MTLDDLKAVPMNCKAVLNLMKATGWSYDQWIHAFCIHSLGLEATKMTPLGIRSQRFTEAANEYRDWLAHHFPPPLGGSEVGPIDICEIYEQIGDDHLKTRRNIEHE